MRTFLSRLFGFFILIGVILAVGIACLPTLMSTDWGRKQTLNWMNRSIPGKVEIRHLDLHWGKGQVIEGFLLKDPEGQTIVEIERFATEGTLWQLMNKNLCLGFTQVSELNAIIVTDQKGETNLQRALGIQSSPLTFLPPSNIILSDVNIESDLFTPYRPLSVHLQGFTQQEDLKGSFDIDLSLNGLFAADWEKFKHEAQHYFSMEGSKEAKIQARVKNFPVDLIDRLVALQNPHLNGLFHALLGDRLNLNLDKDPSDEGLAFHLSVLAPLLQGEMKGIIKEDTLALKTPAIFHFDLTPSAINPFFQETFQLMNPSRLEVMISTLTLPLNFFNQEAASDPCLMGLNTELKLPETNLNISPLGPLKILNLQAHLTSQPCDKLIRVAIIGQAQQGPDSAPFDLHFTSSIDKPGHFSQFMQQIHQSMHSTLTIAHFPLQILPFFQHSEWSERMGSYVNAQLDVHSKDKDKWIGILSFQTPSVVLKEARLSIGKEITLLSPAQFNWTLPYDGLSSLLKHERFVLDQPHPLSLMIKQLQLSLDHPETLKLQLESTLSHVRFPKFFDGSMIQLDHLNLQLDGRDLNHFHSHLMGQVSIFTPEGILSPLFPEPLTFKQISDWKIGKERAIEMPHGQLQVYNSIAHAQVEARLSDSKTLELTQPAQIHYTLTPSGFQALNLLHHQEWPILREAMTADLSIDPTEFKLHSFSLSDLRLQGLMKLSKMAFRDSSGNLPVLENVSMPWVVDVPRNNIYTDVKGVIHSRKEEKPSQISAHLQFRLVSPHYDLAHTQTEIRMNFAGMPTSILSIFFKTPDLNPIIGSIIDLNLRAFFDPTKTKPGYWDLVLDSTHFHAEGRFKLDGNATIYEEHKLPTFRLTITPESYQYLKRLWALQEDLQLTAPIMISGFFSKFNFPLRAAWANQGIFDFHLSTSPIQWHNTLAPTWHLESRLSTENLKDHVNFWAQVHSQTPLTLEGAVTNLFSSSNQLHPWQEMGLRAKLTGQHLTPIFLQKFLFLNLEQKQKLQALFGETLDVSAHCQLRNLNGPVQALIKGAQGYIQMEGLVKEGVLTLTKPLEGAVQMTPLFSQTFLAPNIPLLSTAVGADNPITFTIDSSQFSCPLVPFQLDQVNIGKGQLHLGKIHFRNEGELHSTLSLIRPLADPHLMIWFTPIYLDLHHGILSLKRFDLLVGHDYTLANWGSINLLTHQANFILGLSAPTLRYAFGIQGLDENYILQIPLHTANGKVEIDKKKATTRISSLVAQTHGGSKGKLLGSILDTVLADKGEPYPPPTTHPFPWQDEIHSSPQPSPVADLPNSPEDQSEEGKKKKKKKRKLLEKDQLKDWQEGAVQLLDQLFK